MTARRLQGSLRRVSTTSRSWSTPSKSRHCFPYTGPSSPRSSAQGSHMFLASPRLRILVSPRTIQRSSARAFFHATFFVVTSGTWFSQRENSSRAPNTDRVPVPVRSCRSSPKRSTCLSSSSYVIFFHFPCSPVPTVPLHHTRPSGHRAVSRPGASQEQRKRGYLWVMPRDKVLFYNLSYREEK